MTFKHTGVTVEDMDTARVIFTYPGVDKVKIVEHLETSSGTKVLVADNCDMTDMGEFLVKYIETLKLHIEEGYTILMSYNADIQAKFDADDISYILIYPAHTLAKRE